MKFHLGCAVWAYKNWVGSFYPLKSSAKDFLSLYSERLHTVEGNTTFYAIPEEKTLRKWKAETSSSFRFCLKFPQTITHQGALTPQINSALDFIQRVQILEEKLGVIFAQLPPSYTPSSLEDLHRFLEALSTTDVKLALEVRHPQWFTTPSQEQLHQLLQQYHIGKVLLDPRPIYHCSDNPQRESKRPKPNLPLYPALTADFTLIRFISHPRQLNNQPYLEAWVQQIQQWLSRNVDIYFFVHCPQEEESPSNLRYFQELLKAEIDNIPSLPWNTLNLPQQLSLF